MSDLVISVFDTELKAEEVRLALRKKEADHLADLEDAVVLVRTREGRVKFHHMTHFTVGGVLTGGVLGSLLGVLLMNPVFAVLGLAAGVVVGGISGAMSHMGIDEDFMKDLADHLKPGTSALCVLVRDHFEKALEDVKSFKGKVLHTPLLHDDEAKLKAALDEIMANVGG